MTKEVDSGKPFDIIFFDFAKAFDKVLEMATGEAESLLYQRESVGVDQGLADWKGAESCAEWQAVNSPSLSPLPLLVFHLYI